MKKKICWVYGNHWNFGIVVADTLRMFHSACLELGLNSSIEKELSPNAHNILLENFNHDYRKKLEAFSQEGGEFSIIATELLNEDSFNNTSNNTNDNTQYGKNDYWLERFDNFLKVERLAKSVFHLNPSQALLFSKLLKRKVTFIPHGYVDGFSSVRHRNSTDKDIDILFTGSLTPYRESIINQLSPTKCNVYIADVLTASFHRDDLVARAKVCLNIKQDADWNVFSNSRGHYHISNQSFLLTEECSDACPIINYVEIAQIDIIQEALNTLETNSWLEKSYNSLQAFKEEQRLSLIAQELLINLSL
ncbi:hypothetical protein [Thalassotalea sp. G2M2-11]|uniref:hypothetical protein n=1 Tax=Thalassotalea sp. G2M2-11 TaxID=2787627 RepID=UPI0019D1D4D2|nr:hypothetical protein [Thalassotalea sp. G2M2-11]